MLYTQKLTAQVLILFLERLTQERKQKLMWIVDRHPVHRSQAVKQWLQEHQSAIELLYLPPYSPQLNPAEYLNCALKQGVHFTTTDAQPRSIEATSAVASAQIAKATRSSHAIFPASFHRICRLRKCTLYDCRVNKSITERNGTTQRSGWGTDRWN